MASEMRNEEIAEIIESYGGHWVIVEDGFPDLVHVIDNDIFKKFQAMDWMEDDEEWAAVKRKYLLGCDLKRFSTEQDLNKYIVGLTEAKYGKN